MVAADHRFAGCGEESASKSGFGRGAGGGRFAADHQLRNQQSFVRSSEEKARREFESYKISVSVRGDTAWVLGEWQGSRPRRSSSEFVINIPRNTDLVKVETEGGDLTADRHRRPGRG